MSNYYGPVNPWMGNNPGTMNNTSGSFNTNNQSQGIPDSIIFRGRPCLPADWADYSRAVHRVI